MLPARHLHSALQNTKTLRCSQAKLIPSIRACGCKARRAKPAVARQPEGEESESQRFYDAVWVLGGGLLPDGGLPSAVQARLDLAAELAGSSGRLKGSDLEQIAVSNIICSGSGTPHKPAVLTRTGHVLHEATACADYLVHQRGVPQTSVFRETASYDTIGNAYFCCTMHAIPAGWRSCAVVTSEFHMPRTCSIFSHVFAAAGKSLWNDPGHFTLQFHAAPDGDAYAADVLASRRQREAQSLEEWDMTAEKLHTLKDIHAWLHATHLCYSVSRQGEFGTAAANDARHTKAIASY